MLKLKIAPLGAFPVGGLFRPELLGAKTANGWSRARDQRLLFCFVLPFGPPPAPLYRLIFSLLPLLCSTDWKGVMNRHDGVVLLGAQPIA